MAISVRKGSVSREKTEKRTQRATDTAMFLVNRLNEVGVHTVLVSREQAEAALEHRTADTEFSVADIMKLNYEWNGESISLKVFAQTFCDSIRQKDRTAEDVERIAKAYVSSVKEDPSRFVPQLKAENMSHWRYFLFSDGSVYSPSHILADSPEYVTQKGLYRIYENVLGDRLESFMDMAGRHGSLTEKERGTFLAMEREVSGSGLMQRTLEVNAEKVNERRNRDVANLIQYFEDNTDYTSAEKALILKGAMTYSYSEKKKEGSRNEVRLVRITDSNDVSIPVLGGDAAMVVDGLRKGLDFKESLVLARSLADDGRERSVGRDFTGWKVYAKSSSEEDAVRLQKDAAGTGWCTGGSVSTARTHLSGGDFHIYFRDGEPLIAVRTEDGRLAEPPRGAHEGQFCTPEEEDIAFDYIREGHGITGGADYIADMQDLRTLNRPDCGWRDIIRMPVKRRYENGEFGGDTRSWGDAADRKMRRIMADSRTERFAAGYFTPQEMAENGIRAEDVRGLLNDKCFKFSGDWPSLEFVRGDVEIEKGCSASLLNCRSVGGYVSVRVNGKLALPLCKNVEGYVFVDVNGDLDLSQCEDVKGDVSVYKNGRLALPQCKKIEGHVFVDEDGDLDLSQCEDVKGDVSVYKNGRLALPLCKKIGGNVSVYKNGKLALPLCKNVEGYVFVDVNGDLDLSQCEDVGGNVSVYKNGRLALPQCKNVEGYVFVGVNGKLALLLCKNVEGNVFVDVNGDLDLSQCEDVGGNVYVDEDGRVALPLCKKIGGDVTVRVNGKLVCPPELYSEFHLSDGTVYGYEREGTIYLTPEGINPQTPIHEYAHLWAKAMQKTRPDLWAGFKDALKETSVYDRVLADPAYSFLRHDDDRLCGEVLATAVGERGGEILLGIADRTGSVEESVAELKDLLETYVREDLFELGNAEGIDTDTLTLGVLKSLVERKEVLSVHKGMDNDMTEKVFTPPANVDRTALKNCAIPEGTTGIGPRAFCGCTSLEEVRIPDDVTEIGEEAFRGCTSLRSVEIPESVVSMGKGAFADCPFLSRIVVSRATLDKVRESLLTSVDPRNVNVVVRKEAGRKNRTVLSGMSAGFGLRENESRDRTLRFH